MATDPAASSASKQSQLLRPQSADDRSGFARWLPGLQMLRWYRPDWLKHDIVAGLVLATMLVPVGIAAVILAVVLPLSGGDPLRAIALASAMAIVSGAVCVGAGLIKLGFITELLSKPIRYGYMNGIALTVLLSQVPKLLGFSVESHGPLHDLWSIANGVIGGRVNWTAFLIGAGALATIFALKQSKVVPGLLVAVAGAAAIVGIFELSKSAGVPVLGPLPQGLPSFAIPWINVADFTAVLSGGLAVALISFADTSVLSRAYAARTRTYVDPNQELVGLGAANLAAGFFQGFPISSSSSRTPVAEAAGAKTQLTGVQQLVRLSELISRRIQLIGSIGKTDALPHPESRNMRC
ncbi:sulfate transporter [Hyphomicrobium denitrificans 1NES1]|uniref:Sulfate transporter n=1 Tax=Hyphomicrobium denitrificans 1NES1 TaxID=670307 RepID=N0BBC6_9HYPH|nr:sulfate transporter [Hyphomicrobium denitrificans 1NES1]